MAGSELSLRSALGAVLVLGSALPAGVLAQALPTPGVVQEQIQKRPSLPVTPSDAELGEPAAPPPATTGIAPGGKQIPIERFEITGNTVISSEELRQMVASHEGRSLTLFEIYEVADELTAYYREQGYSVASVTVPAQKVSTGTVKLEVVEGRIGALSVDGNEFYRGWFLERHITGAAVGDVIAEKALERDLLLLNDLPGLKARAVVEPGLEFGESDLTVRAEEKRLDGTARLNNYGRSSIGDWKIEGDLSVNAPLGLGDQLDFNIAHAEGGMLDYFNVRYSAPILYRNLSMEIGHMVSKFKVYSGWQRLSFWV